MNLQIASAVTTGTGKSSGPRNGNGEPLNLIGVPDVAWALQERDAKGSDSDTKEGHLLVMPILEAGALNTNTDQTQNIVCFESRVARNGRGAPSEIVPPLKAESGQTGKGDSAPLAAGTFGVRRLTPTECERLMGLPDGWTALGGDGKPISDSARYRMLGNAVVRPVAFWIAKRILAVAKP